MAGRALVMLALGLVVAGCGTADTDTTPSPTTVPGATAPDTDGPTPTTAVTSTSEAPGSTTTTVPEDNPIEIAVADGEVMGDVPTVEVDLGAEVRLVVRADVSEVVHVHGYDLFFDVEPDASAEIVFTADVPGVFEVELEGSHLLLARVEVS